MLCMQSIGTGSQRVNSFPKSACQRAPENLAERTGVNPRRRPILTLPESSKSLIIIGIVAFLPVSLRRLMAPRVPLGPEDPRAFVQD